MDKTALKTLLKMAMRPVLLAFLVMVAVTTGAAFLSDLTGTGVWPVLFLGGVAIVLLVIRRFV